jgi:hypothetical protein
MERAGANARAAPAALLPALEGVRVGMLSPAHVADFREFLHLGAWRENLPRGMGGSPVNLLCRELLPRGLRLVVFTLDPAAREGRVGRADPCVDSPRPPSPEPSMIHAARVALLAPGLAAAVPAAAKERSEIPGRYKWKLTDLYPSDEAWRAARAGLAKRIPALAAYKGKLGESAEGLRRALDAAFGVRRDLEKLAAYALAPTRTRGSPRRGRRGRRPSSSAWSCPRSRRSSAPSSSPSTPPASATSSRRRRASRSAAS